MAITADCGSWTVTWPWPQIHFLQYYNIGLAVCTAGDCETGVPSASAHLMLFELYNESDAWYAEYMYDLGLTSGIDHVELVDFGMFYVVAAFGMDGSFVRTFKCGFRYPGQSTYGETHGDLPDYRCPQFGTGCNFKGQAIIGNIYSTDEYWEQRSKVSVCWSAISKFDFRPDEITAGYRDMPWGDYRSGMVYKTRRLGDNVVVYGDGGIAALFPVNDPMVTFGLKELKGSGIGSFNWMAGDERIHAFIDNNHDLWTVDEKMNMQKLGYREFMTELVDYVPESGDARVLMSYVPSKKRFYISNGNKCYVLTEHGLYSTHQLPTSIGEYRNDVLAGFFVTGSDVYGRIATEVIDFENRALATLNVVEVATEIGSSATLAVALDYRYKPNTSFTRSSFITANDQGIVFPLITAQEFRVCARCSTYVDFLPDYLLIRSKASDKRFARGINANRENYASPLTT